MLLNEEFLSRAIARGTKTESQPIGICRLKANLLSAFVGPGLHNYKLWADSRGPEYRIVGKDSTRDPFRSSKSKGEFVYKTLFTFTLLVPFSSKN